MILYKMINITQTLQNQLFTAVFECCVSKSYKWYLQLTAVKVNYHISIFRKSFSRSITLVNSTWMIYNFFFRTTKHFRDFWFGLKIRSCFRTHVYFVSMFLHKFSPFLQKHMNTAMREENYKHEYIVHTLASEKLSKRASLCAPGNLTCCIDIIFPNRLNVARHSNFCLTLSKT